GVVLDRTYQLNVGGNMDFKNMLERQRLESKKISKTQAVTSNTSAPLSDRDVHIGPSDYVEWLDDRKWAFVRLEGRNFGDAPVSLEYKLEVWDSPNSAGVIIDAVRAAKIGLDRGIGGALISASSYFMKSPPEQKDDAGAHEAVETCIRGDHEHRNAPSTPRRASRTCSTVGSGVFPPRRESADSDSGPGGECRRLTGIAEPGPGTGSGGSGLSAFATQEPVDQPSDGPGHGTDGCAGDEAGPR